MLEFFGDKSYATIKVDHTYNASPSLANILNSLNSIYQQNVDVSGSVRVLSTGETILPQTTHQSTYSPIFTEPLRELRLEYNISPHSRVSQKSSSTPANTTLGINNTLWLISGVVVVITGLAAYYKYYDRHENTKNNAIHPQDPPKFNKELTNENTVKEYTNTPLLLKETSVKEITGLVATAPPETEDDFVYVTKPAF